MPKNHASGPVGSVVNAIAILRYLSSSTPQGVNAIARAVSLNPSSCFNLLKTLTGEAFLEFNSADKTYRPAPAPGWLFQPQVAYPGWIKWLGTELRKIALQSSVTCGLWQIIGDRAFLAAVADSPLETRIHLTIGQRIPSHLGAMGRCIAAHERLSLKEVARIISALRWQNAPTAESFWNDMQTVARCGWAADEGNYLRGVTTIASAVPDQDGKVMYCLVSTMFSGQYDRAGLRRLGERTASLAREAWRRLLNPRESDFPVSSHYSMRVSTS